MRDASIGGVAGLEKNGAKSRSGDLRRTFSEFGDLAGSDTYDELTSVCV